MTATLDIRLLPIDRLIPADYNPRLEPSAKVYRKLKASLETFGLVEPLIWNESTGRVVGGHLRLRILRELGVTQVPVSVVRLSELKEKALNVVLNNAEAQGRYDRVRLKNLLTELEFEDALDATGFEPDVLRLLALEPVGELPPDDGDLDRVEVTLVTSPATLARLQPDLDALVAAFDLETHVRHG